MTGQWRKMNFELILLFYFVPMFPTTDLVLSIEFLVLQSLREKRTNGILLQTRVSHFAPRENEKVIVRQRKTRIGMEIIF